MESRQILIGSDTCTVRLDGPDTHHVVVILPGTADAPGHYDEICSRLHNSGLRTVLIEQQPGLDEKAIVRVLEELRLPMVNLVGRGEGADLAWLLAANQFDRFISLVVIGRGHPAAPDIEGVIHAPNCPPVEVATTVLVGDSPRERRWADLSDRFVYGDFRVVPVPGVKDLVRDAARAVVTEIVLRTSLW